MFRPFRRMPFLRVIAIAQLLLLARRHFNKLDSSDRRRLRELVGRGRSMSSTERGELFRLLNKVEPRALATATADAFSPFPLPRRLAGKRS